METEDGQAHEIAVDELLPQFKQTARKLFGRYRIPFQDTEDLLQQVMITYVIKQDTVRNPHAWAVGTLRNLCLLYWRRKRRTVVDLVDSTILEAMAEPEAPKQENEDLARDLSVLVAELPGRCRSILHLRYQLGCRPKETARRLGYRDSSIYKLTERCLHALSRALLTVDERSEQVDTDYRQVS